MVRKTDYETRRKDVLRATIELYLDTAQPVSSEALLDHCRFNLSSATIRNVLKDLEEKDYLMHPHTSAGRIPTDSGYRFYINELMQDTQLSALEAKTLERFFRSYLDSGVDIFENATRILSDFTHYAGLVSMEDKHRVSFRGLNYLLEQPEFSDIETIRPILKALEEERLFELMHRQFTNSLEVIIGHENDCQEMMGCSLVISQCSSSGKIIGKIAVLGPKRMAYKRVIPMINYLSELILREFE